MRVPFPTLTVDGEVWPCPNDTRNHLQLQAIIDEVMRIQDACTKFILDLEGGKLDEMTTNRPSATHSNAQAHPDDKKRLRNQMADSRMKKVDGPDGGHMKKKARVS